MRTATLLLLALATTTAAACGEVPGFIDASTGDDDSIDASTVDAEPQPSPVNVITHTRCCTDAPGRKAGVQVFVVHPDGSLGDTATTDGNGEASVDILPGSSVTAFYDRAPGGSLFTFVGVQPGDTLTFGERYSIGGAQTQTAVVTVTWPAQAGTSYYYVAGPCGTFYVGNVTSYADTIYDTCGAGPTDYFILAIDNTGAVTRYGTIASVAHTTQTVNLASFQAAGSFSLDVTGLPPEITGTYLNLYSYAGARFLSGYGTYVTPSGGRAVATTGLPGTAVQTIFTSINLYRDGNFGSQTFTETFAGASAHTLANPRPLPWLSSVIYSPVTQQALWLQAGNEPYDAALLSMYWSRGGGGSAVVAGGSGEYYDWRLLLPPGVTDVKFPEVPAALRSRIPTSDDSVDVYVELRESSSVDSYRDVFALPEWDQYALGTYAEGELRPLLRASYSGGGKRAVRESSLPRHGLPHQVEPPRHR